MTRVLCKLYWLPFELRVNYKVLMYTYEAMHNMAPSYLTCLVNKVTQLGLHDQVETNLFNRVRKIILNRYTIYRI